jgi:CNP1-like family
MIKLPLWSNNWHHRSCVLFIVWLCMCMGAWAQSEQSGADWKESDVPAPPTFDLNRLLSFDVMVQSQLTWGVDTASINISRTDGVVRYVVVAVSSTGVVNAMHEGIRCSTGEFRRYARHTPSSGWVIQTNSEWTPLRESGASRHPQTIAKLGMCDGKAPPSSVQQVLRAMRAGGNDLVK